MVYSLESVDSKEAEDRIGSSGNEMLRFELRVTKLDRIRNSRIRGTLNVGSIGSKLKEARLR